MLPLKKCENWPKIKFSLKGIRIVSIGCKLLKTVGLLGVRLDLAKLRLKTEKNISIFVQIIFSIFHPRKTSILAAIEPNKVRLRNVIPR